MGRSMLVLWLTLLWAPAAMAQTLSFSTAPSYANGGVGFYEAVQVQTSNNVAGVVITLSATSVSNGGSSLSGDVTVTTVTGGAAVFESGSDANALLLNLAGQYTLTATATGYPSVTCAEFTIAASYSAASLEFSTSPVGGKVSSSPHTLSVQPTVRALDAGGNVIAGSAQISLAVTKGGASYTLGGTTQGFTGGTTQGYVTFSGLQLDTAGAGYTMTATAAGATSATATFTVLAGNAAAVGFTTEPASPTGGVAFSVVVEARDVAGNVDSNYDGNEVTLTLSDGSNTVSFSAGTTQVDAASGISSFSDLVINTAGAYRITASAADVAGSSATVQTSPFSVSAGPASSIAFTQPASGASQSETGGTDLSPQPVVQITDAGGNVATGVTSVVTLFLDSAPSGVSTSTWHQGGASATMNAVSGVADFTGKGLTFATSGNYVLRATVTLTGGSTTSGTSGTYAITAGPLAQVSFQTEAAGAAGGTAFSTQPVLILQDAGGNTVTGVSSLSVVLTVATGPTNGVLTGTATVAHDSATGLATFSGLSLNTIGTYTLTVSVDIGSSTITATSSDVVVSAGAATTLSFTTEPTLGFGGVAFATQPAVTALDAGGNTATSASGTVTIAICPSGDCSASTGSGSLSGTTTEAIGGGTGVANFDGNGLNINTVGTYVLKATMSGLTSSESSSLVINAGSATQISFTTQPGDSTGGLPFSPQPVVTFQDAGGNTATANTAQVTIVKVSGSSDLSGTVSMISGSGTGVADFSSKGLAFDTAGDYVIKAQITISGTVIETASSTTIAVTAGPAASMAFTEEPGDSTGGIAFNPQPEVTLVDAGGNVAVNDDTSTVTMTKGSGVGTLKHLGSGSSVDVTVVDGVASFAGLGMYFQSVGSYTLRAESSPLDDVLSSSIVITAGVVTSVVFTTSPTSPSDGGTAFSTQPVVTLRDAGDNTALSSTAAVTLSLAASSTGSGALAGTVTMNAVAGVADFDSQGVNINTIGDYVLTATISDPTTLTGESSTVTIQPGPSASLTIASPSDSTGGIAFGTQPYVEILDAGGNLATGATDSITISVASGSGSLTGTITMAAVAGVANFSIGNADMALTTADAYTLTATSGVQGTTTVTSGSISIVVGPIAAASFTTQPSTSTLGGQAFGTQPAIQVVDAGGNVVTGSSATITLQIASASDSNAQISAGTSMSLVITVSSGVADFASQAVSIDLIGSYTLKAACIEGDISFFSSVSDTITVTADSAVASISFNQLSLAGSGGTALAQQPIIHLLDSGGNIAISNKVVTLTVTTAPTDGAMTWYQTASGTTTISLEATSGVADFSSLGAAITLDIQGNYVITAGTDSNSQASGSIVISPGPAVTFQITTQPSDSDGGAATLDPLITLYDLGTNIAATSAADVTVTKDSSSTGGGSLSGTKTLTPNNGRVTFDDITINSAGTYVLKFAVATISATQTSDAVSILAGNAAQVVFTTGPSDSTGGQIFTTQPVITLNDAGGNLASTQNPAPSVILTITDSADGVVSSNNLLASGSSTMAASAGVADFSSQNLKILKIGTYTMTATLVGTSANATATVTVTAGGVDTLIFFTAASGATGGTVFTTQPLVHLLDAGLNIATGNSDDVIMSFSGSSGFKGSKSTSAVNGVATYTNLRIDTIGTYTLTASLELQTSTNADSSVTVTAGVGAELSFSTQPLSDGSSGINDGTGGTPFAPQPVVTILDAGGNTATDSTALVTITLSTVSGSGALSGTTTKTAVAGVADFAGLALAVSATGTYKLSAAITDPSGVSSELSSQFAIVPGPAVTIELISVADTTGGIGFGFYAMLYDAGGNIATGSASSSITVSVAASGGVSSIVGTVDQTAPDGMATFSGLTLDTAGTYTLTATATGTAAAATHTAQIIISVGPAAQLTFDSAPASGLGGENFPTQPVVSIRDAGGNLCSLTTQVTLSVDGTLGGTVAVAANGAGTSTFSGLKIDTIGSYTLTASVPTIGVTADVADLNAANLIVVEAGNAVSLAFATDAAGGTGGLAFTTQPEVNLVDLGGNVASNGLSIDITIAASGGTSTLAPSGSLTVTCGADGVAQFDLLELDIKGAYTLTASSTGLGTATQSITITTGEPSSLAFSTEASDQTGGLVFGTQPVVRLIDAGGNTAEDATGASYNVVLTSSPSGELFGVVDIEPSSGVATFSSIGLNTAQSYTLTATRGALTVTDTVAITAGPAASLSFTTDASVSGNEGGAVLSTTPVVTLYDAGGNVAPASSVITLSIQSGPSGGALIGDVDVSSSAGVSAFTDLGLTTITQSGTPYVLIASITSPVSASSSASVGITVVDGVVANLEFATQPVAGSEGGGVALATQPVVNVIDAGGNIVTSNTGNDDVVTIAFHSSNAGTGSLTGTLTFTAVNGVADFGSNGITIDTIGAYVLQATSTSVSSAVAATSLTVVDGPAVSMAITTQPSSTGSTGGVAIPTQPVVTLYDAGSNVAVSGTQLNLRFRITDYSTDGSTSFTTGVTTDITSVSGVVTYTDLAIDLVGDYVLNAATISGPALALNSTSVNVARGPPVAVVFTTDPSPSEMTIPFATQPVVELRDAGNNLAADSTLTVTMSKRSGSGALCSSSECTTSMDAVASVADFAGKGLYVKESSGSFRLRATFTASGDSFTGDSATFAISTGPPSYGYFTGIFRTTSSSTLNKVAGEVITGPTVSLFDEADTSITREGVNASISIETSNAATGVLSGTTLQQASTTSGVSQWDNLIIDKVGTYRFVVNVTDATGTEVSFIYSKYFNIVSGEVNSLEWNVIPVGGTGGLALPTQGIVRMLDKGGNVVDNSASSYQKNILVKLEASKNPIGTDIIMHTGKATSSGTLGEADFTGEGMSIDIVGSYVMTAMVDSFSVDSPRVNITAGPALTMVYSTPPAATIYGGSVFPDSSQPVVRLLDAGGNTATSTSDVTITIVGGSYAAPTTGPDTSATVGTLSGTTVVTAVNGFANFTDLAINTVGDYVLKAAISSPISTTVNSAAFPIDDGPIATIAFTTQPGDCTSNKQLGTQPQVEIRDAGGNLAWKLAVGTTVSIDVATGPGALISGASGFDATSNNQGIVSFVNNVLKLNTIGTYVLNATVSGTTITTNSNSVTVSIGPAETIEFSTEPAGALGGSVFSAQPVLTLKDAGANVVSTAAHGNDATVTITKTAGDGTLTGTTQIAAVSGVATHTDLVLDTEDDDYVLTATFVDSGSVTQTASSSVFAVTPGPAASIDVTASPSSSTGGVVFTSQPVATLYDAGGNVADDTATQPNVDVVFSKTEDLANAPGTLTGTLAKTSAAGIASFAGLNLKIDTIGSYTLNATVVDVNGHSLTDISSEFTITAGPTTHMTITQPTDSTGGLPFATQPVVTLLDAGENTVTLTGETALVTVVKSAGPASGTLNGTITMNAVAGVADFAGKGLLFDEIGSNYELTASITDPSAIDVTTTDIEITAGEPVSLAFTTQPVGNTGGLAFATQPQVTLYDAGGNVVTVSDRGAASDVVITKKASGGTGSSGLDGTSTVAAVAGIADFTGLDFDVVGSYTLVATVITANNSPHIVSAGTFTTESDELTMTSGPASQISFLQEPAGNTTITGGIAFAHQPIIYLQDAGGNPANTDASDTVTISLHSSGSGSGTLSGTFTVALVEGVASFGSAALKIDTIGDYVLLAEVSDTIASNLEQTSAQISVVAGEPHTVTFTTQPLGDTGSSDAKGGDPFNTQPVVTLLDRGLNTATDSTTTVVITKAATITDGSAAGSGNISGTVVVNAVFGVATFTNLEINTIGTYRLTATMTSPVEATATSSNIQVVAGAPTSIVFTLSPSASTKCPELFAQQPEVTTYDAGMNIATSTTSTVVLTITSSTNTESATLDGTLSLATSNGVANFDTLSANNQVKVKTEGSYSLTATSSALTAESTVFATVPGVAVRLEFEQYPGDTTGGSVGVQPIVIMYDDGNNIASEPNDALTIDLAKQSHVKPSGVQTAGVLMGTTSVTSVAGVANWTGLDLSFSVVGTYRIKARDVGQTLEVVQPTGSETVVSAGAPATLDRELPDQAQDVIAGSSLGDVVFNVKDAGGNSINDAAVNCTVNINDTTSSAGGTAVLSGTAQQLSSSGSVTFTGLTIDLVGVYVLIGKLVGITTGFDTFAFTVSPGSVTRLEFSTQPTGALGGSALTTQPVVAYFDTFNNSAVNRNPVVALSLFSGPASGVMSTVSGGLTTASLQDTLDSGVGSGHVDYANKPVKLDLITAGTNYVLQAYVVGAPTIYSSGIVVTPGAATSLAFTTQATSTTGDVAFPTQPVVTLQDAGGNVATGDSSSVVITLGTQSSNTNTPGTLSGDSSMLAVAGVANFTGKGLTFDKIATYTLKASVTGLSDATSDTVSVTAGDVKSIVFSVQPGDLSTGLATCTKNSACSRLPVITLLDAGGNTATQGPAQISVTIQVSTGPSGGVLDGTTVTETTSFGLATFSSAIQLDTSGDYVLMATATTAQGLAVNVTSNRLAVMEPGKSISSATTASTITCDSTYIGILDSTGLVGLPAQGVECTVTASHANPSSTIDYLSSDFNVSAQGNGNGVGVYASSPGYASLYQLASTSGTAGYLDEFSGTVFHFDVNSTATTTGFFDVTAQLASGLGITSSPVTLTAVTVPTTDSAVSCNVVPHVASASLAITAASLGADGQTLTVSSACAGFSTFTYSIDAASTSSAVSVNVDVTPTVTTAGFHVIDLTASPTVSDTLGFSVGISAHRFVTIFIKDAYISGSTLSLSVRIRTSDGSDNPYNTMTETYRYSIGSVSGTAVDLSTDISIASLADGNHTLLLEAVDAAGIVVATDSHAITKGGSSAANTMFISDFNPSQKKLSIDTSGASWEYSVDGADPVAGASIASNGVSLSTLTIADGRHVINVYAKDAGGVVVAQDYVITNVLASTVVGPTVVVSSAVAASDTVTFGVAATGAYVKWNYIVDGTHVYSPATFDATSATVSGLVDGTHTIKVQLLDSAGTVTAHHSREVSVEQYTLYTGMSVSCDINPKANDPAENVYVLGSAFTRGIDKVATGTLSSLPVSGNAFTYTYTADATTGAVDLTTAVHDGQVAGSPHTYTVVEYPTAAASSVTCDRTHVPTLDTVTCTIVPASATGPVFALADRFHISEATGLASLSTIGPFVGTNFTFSFTALTVSGNSTLLVEVENADGTKETVQGGVVPIIVTSLPTGDSEIVCEESIVSVDTGIVCTLTPKNGSGQIYADASYFTALLNHSFVQQETGSSASPIGLLAALDLPAANLFRFSFTAPSAPGGVSVVSVRVGSPTGPVVLASPSLGLNITVVDEPTDATTITCASDYVYVGQAVKCTIRPKAAGSANIAARAGKFAALVENSLGSVSAIAAADLAASPDAADLLEFDFTATTGDTGATAIAVTLVAGGTAVSGSSFSLAVVEAPAAVSTLSCAVTELFAGDVTTCTLEAKRADGTAIYTIASEYGLSITGGATHLALVGNLTGSDQVVGASSSYSVVVGNVFTTSYTAGSVSEETAVNLVLATGGSDVASSPFGISIRENPAGAQSFTSCDSYVPNTNGSVTCTIYPRNAASTAVISASSDFQVTHRDSASAQKGATEIIPGQTAGLVNFTVTGGGTTSAVTVVVNVSDALGAAQLSGSPLTFQVVDQPSIHSVINCPVSMDVTETAKCEIIPKRVAIDGATIEAINSRADYITADVTNALGGQAAVVSYTARVDANHAGKTMAISRFATTTVGDMFDLSLSAGDYSGVASLRLIASPGGVETTVMTSQVTIIDEPDATSEVTCLQSVVQVNQALTCTIRARKNGMDIYANSSSFNYTGIATCSRLAAALCPATKVTELVGDAPTATSVGNNITFSFTAFELGNATISVFINDGGPVVGRVIGSPQTVTIVATDCSVKDTASLCNFEDACSWVGTYCTCAAGYSGPDDTCAGCRPGSYKDVPGRSYCKECVAGKYNGNRLSAFEDNCTACPFGGTTLTKEASTIEECTCDAGNTGADAGACTVCAAGTFKALTGSSPCLDCPMDTYSPTEGSEGPLTACAACPVNSGTDGIDASGTVSACSCGLGYAQSSTLPGAFTCSRCPAGKIRSAATAAAAAAANLTSIECEVCPAGQYQPDTGSATCRQCTPSSSSSVGSPSIASCMCLAGYSGALGGPCLACEAGEFKAIAGDQPCAACATDSFAADEAMHACEGCPAGSVGPAGSTDIASCSCDVGFTGVAHAAGGCSSCHTGTFKSTVGDSACSNCPANTYSSHLTSVNSSVCQSCPVHSTSVAGSSNATQCQCNKGYTGADGGVCTLCSSGKFKSVLGSAVCDLCPAGTYNTGQGAITKANACVTCPANSRSPRGSSAMVDCKCMALYDGPGGGPCVNTLQGACDDDACVSMPGGTIQLGGGSISFE